MPDWLWLYYKARTPRISSTEVSIVLGVNNYKSRRALFKEKQNKEIPPKPFNSAAIQHGNDYEPVALQFLMSRLDPLNSLDWRKPRMVLDPHFPLCVSPDSVNSQYGLEIKCLPVRPIPQTVDEIYTEHLLQCFACAHVVNLPWMLFYYNHLNPEESRLYLVGCYLPAFMYLVQVCNWFISWVQSPVPQGNRSLDLHPGNRITKKEKQNNKLWVQEIKKNSVRGPYPIPVMVTCKKDKYQPESETSPSESYNSPFSPLVGNQKVYPEEETRTDRDGSFLTASV